MSNEKLAADARFLIDLAERIFLKLTPAMGFDQGDTDRLCEIARNLRPQYGAIHTDGSRSGGQPVGTNAGAKGDESAFPALEHCADHMRGLTKREWFAGMAMQGMLSAPAFYKASNGMSPEEWRRKTAGLAYRIADAMLTEGKSDD